MFVLLAWLILGTLAGLLVMFVAGRLLGAPVVRDDLLVNELFGYDRLTAAAVLALRVVASVIRDGST